MKLIRKDSLYPGNLTKVERIKRLLQFSEFRAQYLDSVLSPNATADLDTVRVPIGRVPDNHLYVVELKIGSRLHLVKLLMDTGSGLIRTQCRPCKKCFRQRLPMYDSQASTSYHKLPCTHPLCQGDNKRYKCIITNVSTSFGIVLILVQIHLRQKVLHLSNHSNFLLIMSTLESFMIWFSDAPKITKTYIFPMGRFQEF
ncbi:Xylanase inhibitor [Theobroma cacao]|nr:Xylanase inhibitor [Theobroma cacao]